LELIYNSKNFRDGKFLRWPKKDIEKQELLEFILSQVPSGVKLPEPEINSIIKRNINFDDFALLRRELIERKFLNRKNDCSEYWRE
jgi:hypothetical protein